MNVFDKAKCPNCGSDNWEPIQPFDYMKKCNDCEMEFSANPHN